VPLSNFTTSFQSGMAERAPQEHRQGVEVAGPKGKRPLTLREAASAPSFQLTEAGNYQLRFAAVAESALASRYLGTQREQP